MKYKKSKVIISILSLGFMLPDNTSVMASEVDVELKETITTQENVSALDGSLDEEIAREENQMADDTVNENDTIGTVETVDESQIIDKEVTIEDYTKNRAERIIPITDNIKNVLEQIKEVQSNYKYSPQYLFNKKDGTKMTAHQISDIVMKRTRNKGSPI